MGGDPLGWWECKRSITMMRAGGGREEKVFMEMDLLDDGVHGDVIITHGGSSGQ